MKINFNRDLTKSIENIENYFSNNSFKKLCLSKKNYSFKWKNNIIGDSTKIFVDESAQFFSGAYIQGPAYIGPDCVLRPGSYLRTNTFLEENVKIGHASEVKNSFIGKNTNLAHLNYVGDSYISENVNLSAGVICSNYKQLPYGGDIYFLNSIGERNNSNKKMFGCFIGESTKIGCNSVVFPGTTIESNVIIYPLCRVRGYVKKNHIVKSDNEVVKIDE